jgi:hypothetical protein
MFLVPLGTFFALRDVMLPSLAFEHSSATTFAGIISALTVWVVMGTYAYIVATDPANFQHE